MKFNINDQVAIKSLQEMLDDESLRPYKNIKDIYINKETDFIVFPEFQAYGEEVTILEVDKKDNDIPYFISIGVWVPEFMLKVKEDKPKEVNPEIKKDGNKNEFINKFTNKPFGRLFIKLINLDPKISEFSNTAFSKLKKHELVYIANLLQNKGTEKIDANKTTQKELAIYCFNNTKKI